MERKPSSLQLIFDVDGLVHPSQIFEHPSDMVNDRSRRQLAARTHSPDRNDQGSLLH